MKKYNRTVMSGGQIGLSILCGFLALILIAMIFVTAYADYYLSMIRYIPNDDTTLSSSAIASMESEWTKETDPEETGWPEDSEPSLETVDPTDVTQPLDIIPSTFIKHKDLVNILLVGQDRRPDEKNRHLADTMIVVSINKKDKTITLTSFMRDMYVNIPGYKYNKMNSAYAAGGFPMLCDTLMSNFGVVIDGCVEVDFAGFTKVVNALGGVMVEVTESEAEGLNKIYKWGLKPGVNEFNGEMALVFTRVRKGFGDDYARTERQRRFLTAIMNECKNLSLSEMNDLLEELLPMLGTNMSTKKITNYLVELFPIFAQAEIKQLRIPANGAYKSVSITGVGSCLVPDLAKCQKLLADTLLPD